MRKTVAARLTLGLGILAGGAILLTACSGGSKSGDPTTTQATGGQTAPASGAGGRFQQIPGTFGTIAAVETGSVEVQNQQNGQVRVKYTAKTRFSQTAKASAADIKAGSCVSAFGSPSQSSSSSSSSSSSGATTPPTAFTAASVSITEATGGKCDQGFGGGFGNRPSGFPTNRPTGFPTNRPSNLPSNRPSGFPSGARRFGAVPTAFGKVTAANGSTLTISGTRQNETMTYQVTLGAATTYTRTAPATAKALAVGKCAQATGSSDSTGAVNATSMRISDPVNGSCESGFGGFRGFGARNGTASGGGNA